MGMELDAEYETDVIRCIINKGLVLDAMDKTVEAIGCYQEALAMAIRLEDGSTRALCHVNLGLAYVSQRRFEEAEAVGD